MLTAVLQGLGFFLFAVWCRGLYEWEIPVFGKVCSRLMTMCHKIVTSNERQKMYLKGMGGA